jgi:hypothetical protein
MLAVEEVVTKMSNRVNIEFTSFKTEKETVSIIRPSRSSERIIKEVLYLVVLYYCIIFKTQECKIISGKQRGGGG